MVYELPLLLLVGILGIHRQALEETLINRPGRSLLNCLGLASCHPIDGIQLPVDDDRRVDHLGLHKCADTCVEVLHRICTVSDLGYRLALRCGILKLQFNHNKSFLGFLPGYKGYEQAYAYSWLYYIINNIYFFKNMISLDISIIYQIFSRRIIENEY